MARRTTRRWWIAERVLKLGIRARQRVKVRLGVPERVADYEWKCRVEITAKETKSVDVHGLDAFQSLLLALVFIHDELEASGRPVTWEGGEKGDAGFPLQMPQYLPRSFVVKLEKLVQTKIDRYGVALRRRAKRVR